MKWYLLWSVLSICFAFLRTFFLARYLKESELANLSIGLGVVALCGVLISIPLNTSFVVLYKKRLVDQRKVIIKSISDYSLNLIIACVIFCVVIFYIDDVSIEYFVAVSSLFFLISLVNQSILSVEDLASFNQYSSIIATLFTIPVVYILHEGYFSLSSGYIASIVLITINACPAIINLLFVRLKLVSNNAESNFKVLINLAKESFVSAKLLYISGVFGETARMVARLVFQSTSEKLLVCYQIALWLMQPVQTLISHVINMKIYPQLVDGKVSILSFLKYTKISFYIIVLLSALSFFVPSDFYLFFLKIINKTELLNSQPELNVIVFSELIRVLVASMGVVYIIKNRINLLAWFEIAYSLAFLISLLIIFNLNATYSIYMYVLPPLVYAFLILTYNKLIIKNEI
ncbi:hypothetical protein [Shewanella baltica]|uniref:hypothetical protein n=1 Tax=Shewanella baltica TaxID=62322 RepID=UPI003D795DD7